MIANIKPLRRANVIMGPAYIPLCPDHRCDMIAHTWRKLTIFFGCPHCGAGDKAPRVEFVPKSCRRESAPLTA